MPLYQQKKYILNSRPKDLKPEEEVFIVQQTKECFRDYKDYIAKVFTYSSQQWSCEVTGKDGLTYSEAVSSEREASKLHVQSLKENMKCITNAAKKGERSDKKSSLSTISGPNANKRTFDKVLSRTAGKDLTQRTLTCFAKNTGHSKQLICNSKPIKQVVKSGAKRKGSPEVEILLELKLKSKSDLSSPKDTSAKEKTKKAKKLTTFQTHFDVDDAKSNSTKNVHSNEKELKIIKKNASKGQQTLSQMFKNSSLNDADIKREVGKVRSKTVTYSNQGERARNGNRKPLVTTFSKSHFAAKVSLSPSLKPVNVPEELRKEYGDLLMITEFVYFYGKFLSQDRDIVHSRPVGLRFDERAKQDLRGCFVRFSSGAAERPWSKEDGERVCRLGN
ncbi:uncharacterized protein LOC124453317 isoform X2 [Xenia sp. Carnegie-2017]|uniref:uncharacterized protein LOC124453317 isoform X2 n=1 Tax=Xenia sp. Carnegie-2017 TaxID=2897299 RepID=UPI001F0452FA|nr:uncharacterized protein LOC124453317 isoform X2 [Xenia sp. Carnegie-2017]